MVCGKCGTLTSFDVCEACFCEEQDKADKSVKRQLAEFKEALAELLKAFLYEAAQGDGVSEDHVATVQRCRKLLGMKPMKGEL